jgi:hypothetical protein
MQTPARLLVAGILSALVLAGGLPGGVAAESRSEAGASSAKRSKRPPAQRSGSQRAQRARAARRLGFRRIRRIRRGRRVTVLTHGDYRAMRLPTRSGARAAAVPGDLPTTWCGSPSTQDDTASELSNAPQIKAVYAYPTDEPNRFAQYADRIQSDVRRVQQAMTSVPGSQRAIRFDLGTSCGPRYVDILILPLPHSSDYYFAGGWPERFDRVDRDVQAAMPPLGGGLHSLAIYADHLGVPGWPDGQGTQPHDDTPGLENRSNQGGELAVVFGSGGSDFVGANTTWRSASLLLHEISHTLGAVSLSAPHSTKASHCTDEWDFMCYADGGPRNDLTFPCPGSEQSETLDCGGDDYFSPAPAAGSWLAGHWNVYDSLFLCAPSRCDQELAPPVANIAVTPAVPRPGQPVTLDATGSSGTGGIVKFAWSSDDPALLEGRATNAASVAVTLPAPGLHRLRVRLTDSEGSFADGVAEVTVVNDPPVARLTASAQTTRAGRSVVLRAGESSDDDAIVAYRFDRDGDGHFETEHDGDSSLAVTFDRPGTYYPGVQALDRFGAVGEARVTLRVLPALLTLGATPSRQRRSSVRARGVLTGLRSARAGTVALQVRLGAGRARALGLVVPRGATSVVLGARTVRVRGASTTMRARVRLNAQARRALRRARTTRLTVSATLSRAGSAPQRASRTVTVVP